MAMYFDSGNLENSEAKGKLTTMNILYTKSNQFLRHILFGSTALKKRGPEKPNIVPTTIPAPKEIPTLANIRPTVVS